MLPMLSYTNKTWFRYLFFQKLGQYLLSQGSPNTIKLLSKGIAEQYTHFISMGAEILHRTLTYVEMPYRVVITKISKLQYCYTVFL